MGQQCCIYPYFSHSGFCCDINGLLRKPIVVDALEDNGAIACVTNILKENRNFTWTICSADDELRMTEFYGYHYETITFLRELQDLEKNPEIIMPTQNVYFLWKKFQLIMREVPTTKK